MRWSRRFLCALLAFALAASGALAEFSPEYEKLTQAYREGGAVSLTLSASAEKLPGMTDSLLETVNGWLEKMTAGLSAKQSGDGSESRVALTFDGETLFSADVRETNENVLTTFPATGKTYLTRAGEADALTLLGGGAQDSFFPADPDAFWQTLLAALPGMYTALLDGGAVMKGEKSSTSIKNAGTSARFENYTLTADQMNGVWAGVWTDLMQALSAAFPFAGDSLTELDGQARAAVFSGTCRFKRMYDQEDSDMGLQFTGKAAFSLNGVETTRKVTLFCGYREDKGFYFSLAMPAVKGSDNWKLTLGAKETAAEKKNTLELSGSLTRKAGDESASFTLSGKLNNALDAQESLTGKITLSGKENGVKKEYTLTPEITLSETGAQGSVLLSVKESGTETAKITFQGALAQTDFEIAQASTALDLRDMTRDEAENALSGEQAAMTRAFMTLVSALSEKERALFTHALRTDEWMTAPSVEVVEGNGESIWSVEEESEK